MKNLIGVILNYTNYSPHERHAVPGVEGELEEAVVHEHRDEVVAQVVAVVEDEPVLGGRPQHDLELVPQGRFVPEAGKNQVRRPPIEGGDLKQKGTQIVNSNLCIH